MANASIMKPQIVFGPYFTSAPLTGEPKEQGLQPLGQVCEWAGPNTNSRIDLLRYRPIHAPRQCRLEHLVFPANQLPCCLPCHPAHVVQGAGTTYLPLEALLLQIYRTCNVPRHIFTVLAELASLVPLHSSVSRPVTGTGLLAAPVEAQGFRLNTVLCHDRELFAEVAWQPNSQSCRFHVCICRFETGSRAIEQYHGTPLQKMLETTFRKLTGQLDASLKFSLAGMDGAISFRPFAPGDAELKEFDLLMRAVNEQRTVRFMYRNRGQVKAQRRQVHPYHIGYVDNHWCMFAFDVDRKAIRTFVLARLSKPELTRKRFTMSQKFDVNNYLAGSLGLYRGEDDFEVVVELDAWAADDVRGRRLDSSQELKELPKGMLRVRLRLNSLEEVERWILSMGTHATVIRPEKLRERLSNAAWELCGRYGRA